MPTRRSFLSGMPVAPAAGRTRAEAVEWFRKAKFGLFIHYGLYSLEGGIRSC